MARYNIRNIRTMLTEGFSAEELRELAFDEPDFRPVYDQLSSSAGKTEIVQHLIEYAERRLKMDHLLVWARERNPARYGQHQPYSDSLLSSTPSRLGSSTILVDNLPSAKTEWDVFISHASEDEPYVSTLAQALQAKGLRVWYDQLTLKVGDSLYEEIDRRLANSRYGIVILSPNFFNKPWAKSELDALAVRKNAANEKVILPVWHNITMEQVIRHSPLLAGRLAVSSGQGLDRMVAELLRVINPIDIDLSQADGSRDVFLSYAERDSPLLTRTVWDVFISHANEDKPFVRELANALEQKGLRVWYDTLTLKVGDSLREEIDRGLANSRYGIVVLSPNFFNKHWAKSELDALIARQNMGQKVILPVWHNITAEQVMQYSSLLVGRLRISSASGIEQVIEELLRSMDSEPVQTSQWDSVNLVRERSEPDTDLESVQTVKWDCYICHNGEDKPFVRNLAQALKNKGYCIWYDEFTLKVGDNLQEEIKQVLASSRYYITVLSPNFFKDSWSKSELDTLLKRETVANKKMILPIWHNLAADQVKQYSSIMANRVAIPSTYNIEHIVKELSRVLDEGYLKAKQTRQSGNIDSTEKDFPFDVFLCHNSRDKDTVRRVAVVLRQVGLKPWFDEERILGGDKFIRAMDQGLSESSTTAIFVGSQGWGRWQLEELEVALTKAIDQENHRVIPVLLQPLTEVPDDFPAFLKTRHALRLPEQINKDSIAELIRSIRGRQ